MVGPPCCECLASSVWIDEIMLAKFDVAGLQRRRADSATN